MTTKAGRGAAPKNAPKRRLRRDQRERQIIEEAIVYFAECGFGGGTQELAKRIGITQPLLFNYFSNKDELIERIYQEIFPSIWLNEWIDIIDDESVDLSKRLTAFYQSYTQLMLNKENTRLFLFASLAGYKHARQYYGHLNKEIFVRIALALRRRYGRLSSGSEPTDREMEIVHSLHGSIYHLAVRRWVQVPPLIKDPNDLIELKVKLFLKGAAAMLD